MKKIGVGTVTFDEEEIKEVAEVLKSGKISAGKKTSEFEEKVANLHGKKYGVFCNSGQSALEVALLALKEMYGMELAIVPTITYISTVFAVIRSGLSLRFCDVYPTTYNINLDKFDLNFFDKYYKVIPIFVDMFGLYSGELEGRPILRDACENLFGKVGSNDEVICFSFYVAHTITTGIGGMCITNNKKLARIMRSYVNHGRRCVCSPCLANSGKLCPNAKDKFIFERVGTSYRGSDILSAVGLAQLKKKDFIMKKRKENGAYLIKEMKRNKLDEYLQLPKKKNNSFMLFPLVIKDKKINREKLVEYLAKNNIESRKMMPVTNQPIIKKLLGSDIEDKFPVAKYINKNGFYIGCHQGLSKEDLDYMVETFAKFFKEKI